MTSKATIPRLGGYVWGQNFARFCERFKDYVTLTDCKELLDLLLLSNVCEETWVKLNKVKMETGERGDIEKVIEFYKTAYNEIEDRRSFQARFMMIKQEQDEGMETYGRRLDELAAKAYPNEVVQNEVKTPTFIRGLKDQRIKLQLVQGDALEYSQIVKAAVRCEQASIILEPHNLGMDVFSTDRIENPSLYNEGATGNVDRLNSASEKTNYSPKFSANVRSNVMTCWSCGSEDHIQRDCKLIKCFICAGPHLKRECPKLGRNNDMRYNSRLNTRDQGYNYNRGGYMGASNSTSIEGNSGYRARKCTYCLKMGHEEINCWSKQKEGTLNRGGERHATGTK